MLLVYIYILYICIYISLLAYFVSPSNLHYCYQGTVECIFSCIYFCENINIEKKVIQTTSLIQTQICSS